MKHSNHPQPTAADLAKPTYAELEQRLREVCDAVADARQRRDELSARLVKCDRKLYLLAARYHPGKATT